jgi:hypothetical protein
MERDVIVRGEPDRLLCGGERGGHGALVGVRTKLRKPRRTRRGQRIAADRFHDPIEFKGPEGAGMHLAC